MPPGLAVSIIDISEKDAIASVSVINDGGAGIINKGICWNAAGNPTISDSKTSNGKGSEPFTAELDKLNPGTKYFVRAYAINKAGTGYSNEVSFTSYSISLAQITTENPTEVSSTSATTGGNILFDGGDPISSRGICWSTVLNPTINDNKTMDGTGSGKFISEITGLLPGTSYYIRAYAVNSAGISYGVNILLTTYAFTNAGQLTDIDGVVYNTISINGQIWMKENLNVTHYSNGDPIPDVINDTEWWSLSSGAYCDYDNNPDNSKIYGRLYNWFAVNDSRNLCPQGWHVPSYQEWESLIQFLGGDTFAGGKLKEDGTSHWGSPNTGATNLSGFTALPAGNRLKVSLDGVFFSEYYFMGGYGILWTSPETTQTTATVVQLGFMSDRVEYYQEQKFSSCSVRCLKNQ